MRLASTILAAVVACVGVARADNTQQRADALFAEGRRLSDAHDDAGACAKFAEAIALAPEAVGTMLNLGACNERLEKYATALVWYRKARAAAHAADLRDSEATAAERADKIAALVATATIAISAPAPIGLVVTVDGTQVELDHLAHVELDPGHHAIDAIAPGYRPVHTELDAAPASHHAVGLAPVAVGAAPGPEPAPAPSHRRTVALYVAAGGGGALIAGGIAAAYAKIAYDRCVDHGTPLPRCTNGGDGVDGANHATAIAHWVATPLIGAGVVLAGYATFLYLTAPAPPRVIERVAWRPLVGVDRAGIAVVGRF